MKKHLNWQQNFIDEHSLLSNKSVLDNYVQSCIDYSDTGIDGYASDGREEWKSEYLYKLLQERLGDWLNK